MIAAAGGGQEAIVRLCHTWGANDVEGTMVAAAENGHKVIVRLCYDELGATKVNWAMTRAAEKKGQEEIVRLLHDELHADKVDWALADAAAANQDAIVKLCLEWGATNVHEAMGFAILCSKEAIRAVVT